MPRRHLIYLAAIAAVCIISCLHTHVHAASRSITLSASDEPEASCVNLLAPDDLGDGDVYFTQCATGASSSREWFVTSDNPPAPPFFYSVCRSEVTGTFQNSSNILALPPLDVADIRRLEITVSYEFTSTSCLQVQNEPRCRDRLHVVVAEEESLVIDWDSPGYFAEGTRELAFLRTLADNPENETLHPILLPLSSRMERSRSVDPREVGEEIIDISGLNTVQEIRVLFVDSGICSKITNVTFSHNFCDAATVANATFPASNETIRVEGSCLMGYVHVGGATPTTACNSDGEFEAPSGCVLPADVNGGGNGSPSTNSSSTAAIVGGVVGSVALLVLVLIGLLFLRSKKTGPMYEDHQLSAYPMTRNVLYQGHFNTNYNGLLYSAPENSKEGGLYEDPTVYQDPTDLKALIRASARVVAKQNVQKVAPIGAGEFGEVFHATVKFPDAKEHIDCAVKTLRPGSVFEDQLSFLQEAAIMMQFHHENVIGLLGVVLDGNEAMIITELMGNGSLLGYLSKKKSSLKLPDLVKLSCDIARGMSYLSLRGFIHRDLAARNVLISSSEKAKIADFGLSTEVESNQDYFVSEGGKIPIKWTAPEAIRHGY